MWLRGCRHKSDALSSVVAAQHRVRCHWYRNALWLMPVASHPPIVLHALPLLLIMKPRVEEQDKIPMGYIAFHISCQFCSLVLGTRTQSTWN